MNDIKEVLREVLPEADKQLVLNELGEKEHSFSPEFEKKLKRKAALYFRNGKYVGESGRYRSLLVRRALAVACALVLLVGIAFNAEAIGDFIARWVVDPGSASTHISFDVPEGVEVPKTIETEYTLGCIPEGYTILKATSLTARASEVYSNSNGDTLSFVQSCYHSFYGTFDTENALVSEITVSGMRGYSLHKSDGSHIVWENGEYCFLLSSSASLSVEDLITVACSVEKRSGS